MKKQRYILLIIISEILRTKNVEDSSDDIFYRNNCKQN